MKKAKTLLVTFLCAILLFPANAFANSVEDIEIVPDLDISRFFPYRIFADVLGNPVSVVLDIVVLNGQLGEEDPPAWDYYVDGTPDSAPITMPMEFHEETGKWRSPLLFPDSIYPEIFFVGSEVTWFNTPSDMIVQRNNYQLLHFKNVFEMIDDMTFFIELYATPRAHNSADLQVYLVSQNKTSNFFNSDWRNSPDVELVGTISRNDPFHHTHTGSSSHYVIALFANEDGTLGSQNLNIDEDFWIIIYSNSPNNARGWNLKYHPSCDDRGRWYTGSQSGWTVSSQSGCPDSHIHIARRDANLYDGLSAKITADFGGGQEETLTEEFFFYTLPNLPPNSTSFITPVPGGLYDGGLEEEIEVSWEPATDPNNDPLIYTIYLLDEEGEVMETLIENTEETSFTWDISGVDDGIYSLKGLIIEDIPEDPLSTEFSLDGNFTIDKILPITSLTTITISSDNPDPTWAKEGDTITVEFTAEDEIEGVEVMLFPGGDEVTGTVEIENPGGNDWTASYTVNENDTDGIVGLKIMAENLDQIYVEKTDDSYVIVDTTPPEQVIAMPGAGTYDEPQEVELSSGGADIIRYTTNEADPTCEEGNLYEDPIGVSAPVTIKAISCDFAGNESSVKTFEYEFQYTVTFDGNTGTGHTPTFKLIHHGESLASSEDSLPTDPSKAGHTFTEWNTEQDGTGDTFNEDTVVMENMTVYAQWEINEYTLTYHGNGNTGGDPHPPEQHDYGTEVTIKDENTLVKDDHVFYGWNTGSGGEGTYYDAGDQVEITDDLDLYAQWLEIDKCTVIFNGNGGESHSPGTITVECDESLNDAGEDLPTNPSRTGYTFTEWNTLMDGTGDTFEETTNIAEEMIVYAQWTANTYTLTFNAQGGDLDPGEEEKSVIYESEVGELPVPVKDNYEFFEWNSKSDGSGETYTAETVYMIDDDITVYAQYTGSVYEITFDARGGSVEPETTAVIYGEEVGELPVPEKEGYTFVAWNTQDDGNGEDYNSTTVYENGGNITLYAIWEGNAYLIGFNSLGGTTFPSQEVTYGSEVGSLPVSEREGYIFSGWYTEPGGEGMEYTSQTIYEVLENLLLFAYWVEIPPPPDDDDDDEETTSGGLGLFLLTMQKEKEEKLPGEDVEETPEKETTPVFRDVPFEDTHNKAVEYFAKKGTIEGYGDDLFHPRKLINRAEIVKIAVLAASTDGSIDGYGNCFPDVKDDWYAKYVCYAKEKGWVQGYVEGEFTGGFGPGKFLSKAEMFKILFKSQEIQTPEIVTERPFEDVPTESWFAGLARKAKEMGLLEEDMERFDPHREMERSEVMEYFYRVLTSS